MDKLNAVVRGLVATAQPEPKPEGPRLEKETLRQRRFREDMAKAGIKIRTYSGRGMFGRETYGVSCGGRREGAVSEGEVYRATSVRLKSDTLGLLGSILYVG